MWVVKQSYETNTYKISSHPSYEENTGPFWQAGIREAVWTQIHGPLPQTMLGLDILMSFIKMSGYMWSFFSLLWILMFLRPIHLVVCGPFLCNTLKYSTV